ncbi:MAG: 16S rRNA (guanine(1516)-N(2))-methyltransferase, partial [Haemophilus parainfluenzae]
RPLHAPPLAAHLPSFTLKSKTVRFDVYLKRIE